MRFISERNDISIIRESYKDYIYYLIFSIAYLIIYLIIYPIISPITYFTYSTYSIYSTHSTYSTYFTYSIILYFITLYSYSKFALFKSEI